MKRSDFAYLIVGVIIFSILFTIYASDVTPVFQAVEEKKIGGENSVITFEHLIWFGIFLSLNTLASLFLLRCAFAIFLSALTPFIVGVAYVAGTNTFPESFESNPSITMMALLFVINVAISLVMEIQNHTWSVKELMIDSGLGSISLCIYAFVMILGFNLELDTFSALKWSPIMYLISMIFEGQINLVPPFRKVRIVEVAEEEDD